MSFYKNYLVENGEIMSIFVDLTSFVFSFRITYFWHKCHWLFQIFTCNLKYKKIIKKKRKKKKIFLSKCDNKTWRVRLSKLSFQWSFYSNNNFYKYTNIDLIYLKLHPSFNLLGVHILLKKSIPIFINIYKICLIF